MYCPKCHKTYPVGSKFCMNCEEDGMPIRLVDESANKGGFNLNLGDANAISGGVNLSDSHNVQNIDNSIHNTCNTNNVTNNTTNTKNVTNTTNNINNVTHNITNVAAQKSELQIHQENLTQYREKFKRAYDDGIITPEERFELSECGSRLHLSPEECKKIEVEVKREMNQVSRTEELSRIDEIDLEDFEKSIQRNDVAAIKNKLGVIESIASNSLNDDVQYLYYMALSVLEPKKCIEKFKSATVSNYWRSFWSYIAYLKTDNIGEARSILGSLTRKFTDYPENNVDILAAVGAYIQEGSSKASRYLSANNIEISPMLSSLYDSLVLLLYGQNAGIIRRNNGSNNFYLVNIFNCGIQKPCAHDRIALKDGGQENAQSARVQQQNLSNRRNRTIQVNKMFTFDWQIWEILYIELLPHKTFVYGRVTSKNEPTTAYYLGDEYIKTDTGKRLPIINCSLPYGEKHDFIIEPWQSFNFVDEFHGIPMNTQKLTMCLGDLKFTVTI